MELWMLSATEAVDKLRRREDLDSTVLHKMLNENPSRFYGL